MSPRHAVLTAALAAVATLGAYGPDGTPRRRATRLTAGIGAWALGAWALAIALPGLTA